MIETIREAANVRRRAVLLAWELGGGLGHVQRLLPIAAELAGSDCRIVFALRRPENAEVIRQRLPAAKVLQAPVHLDEQQERNTTGAFNYADILHRCGYDAMEHLGPVVSRWRELLDLEKPSLVVCDHSPTLILAAAGRVPVVNIGSGFATPPPGRPFLTLFPASARGAKEREAAVLRAINEVHGEQKRGQGSRKGEQKV